MSDFDVSVAAFGAAGDGLTDDTAALQAAFAACMESGRTLHLRPRGAYRLTAALVIDGACNLRLDGHGATLRMDAAGVSAVLHLANGVWMRCEDVTFDAQGANYALHCAGAGGSRFSDCTFMGARLDGIHLAALGAAGGNGGMRFERCRTQHNGKRHDVHVSTSGGLGALVDSADAGFMSRGVRPGDFLHVGVQWLQVAEVLSETQARLALHPPALAVQDAPATLHVGDGYREESFNDNNLVTLRDCLFRGNAGSGARFAGLFGARVVNGQSDFNGAFGFAVGMAPSQVVKQSSFRDCYVEGNGGDAAFHLGHADGCVIDTLNTDQPPVRVSNPSFVVASVTNAQDAGAWVQVPGQGLVSELLTDALLTHSTPPAPRHGRIAFARQGLAVPLSHIGWLCIGNEWFPFGKVEV